MTDQELHALEVELDEYGSISKEDALRLIAEVRRLTPTWVTSLEKSANLLSEAVAGAEAYYVRIPRELLE